MDLLNELKVVAAESGQRPAILALLRENDLPVGDLDENKTLFACLKHGSVIGTGGLEFLGDCALLRSISIRKDLQKKGLGKFVVAQLEKIARKKGINCLYLLTTTAKDFFIKEGYEMIDRQRAPIEIKNTTQFSSICAPTATMMRKFLA